MKYVLYILVLGLSIGELAGQSTYRLIKQGNRELNKENFSEAEVFYRKALDQDAELNIAHYNIANAKYLQGDFDAAIAKYEKNVDAFELKKEKAEAYHNIGNAYLSQEKYEESIEAYKNALKLAPQDMDTKYNLAYAQLKLKEQQEQEQQEQQEQEENQEEQEEDQEQNEEEKDQEGDEEDSEKDQDGDEEESDDGEEKDSEDGDEKEDGSGDEEKDGEGDEEQEQDGAENGEEEQEQSGKANDAKLSQEEAEQILKMLQSEEGKLQEKLDEPEGDPVNVIIEKDW